MSSIRLSPHVAIWLRDCARNTDAVVKKHNDEDHESDHELSIVLATRAAPLIDILERASAANAPVMWDIHVRNITYNNSQL